MQSLRKDGKLNQNVCNINSTFKFLIKLWNLLKILLFLAIYFAQFSSLYSH